MLTILANINENLLKNRIKWSKVILIWNWSRFFSGH